jgi:hypothetical protein
MSRWRRGEAVAIHAPAYQRSLLDLLPANRISQCRSCFSSALAVSAHVSSLPAASVSVKSDATRRTDARLSPSRNWRSRVQLP